jgi:hypothetical protein
MKTPIKPSSMIRRISRLCVLSAACAATASAASFEWSQAVPPGWSTKDAAQNKPVTVIDGHAYDSTNLKAYKVGDLISLWTESDSENQVSDHVLASADVESTYEIELESPGILKQIDLWVDNASEYRNAADVEILVSYDGDTFEKVIATGNQCGSKVAEGTCNVLTFDLSDQTKPVKKVRVVDKIAVTAVQGPRSPRWLQWDVFLKQ